MCSPDPNSHLHAALEHARQLFCYSAGQRLSAIRYYFVAFAVIVAGYGQVLGTNQLDDVQRQLTLCVLTMLAAFLSLVFFALDVRNASMVSVEEQALKAIEEKLAHKLEVAELQIADGWEMKGSVMRHHIIQYRTVMPVAYAVFMWLTAVLAWWHWEQASGSSAFHPPCASTTLLVGIFLAALAAVCLLVSHHFGSAPPSSAEGSNSSTA